MLYSKDDKFFGTFRHENSIIVERGYLNHTPQRRVYWSKLSHRSKPALCQVVIVHGFYCSSNFVEVRSPHAARAQARQARLRRPHLRHVRLRLLGRHPAERPHALLRGRPAQGDPRELQRPAVLPLRPLAGRRGDLGLPDAERNPDRRRRDDFADARVARVLEVRRGAPGAAGHLRHALGRSLG